MQHNPQRLIIIIMQKITPFLWFDGQAEEAANFYVSVFSSQGGNASGEKSSKITHVTPGPNGKAAWVSFVIDGQEFMALNGGPQFKFTEATSFFVSCNSQDEVNFFWEKLSDGGSEGQCGWLKDKYGLSWQIIPKALSEFLGKDKSGKVMQAMLKMTKIETDELKKAYEEGLVS